MMTVSVVSVDRYSGNLLYLGCATVKVAA